MKSSALLDNDDVEVSAISNQPQIRPTGFPKSGAIILSFSAGVLLAGLGLGGYWLVGNGEGKESNMQPIGKDEPGSSAEELVEPPSALNHPNTGPNPRHASEEGVSANSGMTTLPNHELPALDPFIHPTKMGVLYRGVYNPINIRVPGYEDKYFSVTVTNGTLGKDTNGWNVRPGAGSMTSIRVTLTNPDGDSNLIGEKSFRVKNAPNPQPYFAGKGVNDETIRKAELEEAEGVVANMMDFDFDMRFDVVEFRLAMIVSGTPIEMRADGSALNNQMRELLAKAKPGQKLYIEGIKARGPDGTMRNLGALSFKII